MIQIYKILKASLKWLFAHLGKILLSLTVIAMVTYVGGIFHVYETIWIYVKLLLLLQIPLWSAIALVLLSGVYIYLIIIKDAPLNTSTPAIEYISVAKYKWKVTIYNENYHEVDEVPLCLEHDLPLLFENSRYFCPEFRKNNCDIEFPSNVHYKIYGNAKSYIDKELRKKHS